MIRFISDAGASIEFEAAPERLYRWSRDYWSRLHRDGARVDVAYDPLDPSKAFVVGRPDPQASWAIAYSVVFVISGVLILVTQFPR